MLEDGGMLSERVADVSVFTRSVMSHGVNDVERLSTGTLVAMTTLCEQLQYQSGSEKNLLKPGPDDV